MDNKATSNKMNVKKKSKKKSSKKAVIKQETEQKGPRKLHAPTPEHPLNVVVIHGDPTKPNKILPGGRWDADDFEAVDRLKDELSRLKQYRVVYYLCNHDTLFTDLRRLYKQGKFDLVLQFCDEGYMNDPKGEILVTAMLDALRIPYTGTGTHSYGLSIDKDFTYAVCTSLGVPHPRSERFAEDQPLDHHLEYPVLLKPCCTDGSFGITQKSVCKNSFELNEALKMVRETFHVRGPVLVQEFLPGMDVNFGIIGNPSNLQRALLLPITEEDYSAVPSHFPRILGFESKWLPQSPYWLIKSVPTTLSAEHQQLIRDSSVRMMKRLGYRDYCRFDWRLDAKGNPRLLELNPNCGWCEDGHLSKMCATAGMSYGQMLEAILNSCVDRVLDEQKVNEQVGFLSMDDLLLRFNSSSGKQLQKEEHKEEERKEIKLEVKLSTRKPETRKPEEEEKKPESIVIKLTPTTSKQGRDEPTKHRHIQRSKPLKK